MVQDVKRWRLPANGLLYNIREFEKGVLLLELIAGLLNDSDFSSSFQYTIFYKGFASAFREVSYGVLLVSAF